MKIYASNIVNAISGAAMYFQVAEYYAVSANTTINLLARQNSGSSLAANSRMTAIRLK